MISSKLITLLKRVINKNQNKYFFPIVFVIIISVNFLMSIKQLVLI